MEKEELQKLLLEAKGQKEFWREKYIAAWFWDGKEFAEYAKWSARVKYLESITN